MASPDLSGLAANAETALIHLYRGELGRMVAYRRRLDTTTNWALSTTTAVVGLTLGSDGIPHIAILVAMTLLLFFAWLEAARYRSYETSRCRVQLLERGFFLDVLGGDGDPSWLSRLRSHLEHPAPPLDQLAALGVRLRRDYRGLYLVLLLGWLLKLELLGQVGSDPQTLLERARYGLLPGWAVVAAVTALYAGLIAVASRSAAARSGDTG